MADYHDNEWGEQIHEDDVFFERLTLEIFQAGLNWRMILHKRVALNRAFHNFSIPMVSKFGTQQVEQLLSDSSIIRNRRKIEATVKNAQAFTTIQRTYGSFQGFLEVQNDNMPQIFKEIGDRFYFTGPKVTEWFLMSVGKIRPPHDANCWKATS